MYTEAGMGDIVLQALFITMAVFVGLTIFTVQSKIDFSFLGAGLGVCLWILIVWGFVISIFGWKVSERSERALRRTRVEPLN